MLLTKVLLSVVAIAVTTWAKPQRPIGTLLTNFGNVFGYDVFQRPRIVLQIPPVIPIPLPGPPGPAGPAPAGPAPAPAPGGPAPAAGPPPGPAPAGNIAAPTLLTDAVQRQFSINLNWNRNRSPDPPQSVVAAYLAPAAAPAPPPAPVLPVGPVPIPVRVVPNTPPPQAPQKTLPEVVTVVDYDENIEDYDEDRPKRFQIELDPDSKTAQYNKIKNEADNRREFSQTKEKFKRDFQNFWENSPWTAEHGYKYIVPEGQSSTLLTRNVPSEVPKQLSQLQEIEGPKENRPRSLKITHKIRFIKRPTVQQQDYLAAPSTPPTFYDEPIPYVIQQQILQEHALNPNVTINELILKFYKKKFKVDAERAQQDADAAKAVLNNHPPQQQLPIEDYDSRDNYNASPYPPLEAYIIEEVQEEEERPAEPPQQYKEEEETAAEEDADKSGEYKEEEPAPAGRPYQEEIVATTPIPYIELDLSKIPHFDSPDGKIVLVNDYEEYNNYNDPENKGYTKEELPKLYFDYSSSYDYPKQDIQEDIRKAEDEPKFPKAVGHVASEEAAEDEPEESKAKEREEYNDEETETKPKIVENNANESFDVENIRDVAASNDKEQIREESEEVKEEKAEEKVEEEKAEEKTEEAKESKTEEKQEQEKEKESAKEEVVEYYQYNPEDLDKFIQEYFSDQKHADYEKIREDIKSEHDGIHNNEETNEDEENESESKKAEVNEEEKEVEEEKENVDDDKENVEEEKEEEKEEVNEENEDSEENVEETKQEETQEEKAAREKEEKDKISELEKLHEKEFYNIFPNLGYKSKFKNAPKDDGNEEASNRDDFYKSFNNKPPKPNKSKSAKKFENPPTKPDPVRHFDIDQHYKKTKDTFQKQLSPDRAESKYHPSRQNLIETSFQNKDKHEAVETSIVHPLYSGIWHGGGLQELFKTNKPVNIPFDYEYSASHKREHKSRTRRQANYYSKDSEDTFVEDVKKLDDNAQYVPAGAYTEEFSYVVPEPEGEDGSKLKREAEEHKDGEKLFLEEISAFEGNQEAKKEEEEEDDRDEKVSEQYKGGDAEYGSYFKKYAEFADKQNQKSRTRRQANYYNKDGEDIFVEDVKKLDESAQYVPAGSYTQDVPYVATSEDGSKPKRDAEEDKDGEQLFLEEISSYEGNRRSRKGKEDGKKNAKEYYNLYADFAHKPSASEQRDEHVGDVAGDIFNEYEEIASKARAAKLEEKRKEKENEERKPEETQQEDVDGYKKYSEPSASEKKVVKESSDPYDAYKRYYDDVANKASDSEKNAVKKNEAEIDYLKKYADAADKASASEQKDVKENEEEEEEEETAEESVEEKAEETDEAENAEKKKISDAIDEKYQKYRNYVNGFFKPAASETRVVKDPVGVNFDPFKKNDGINVRTASEKREVKDHEDLPFDPFRDHGTVVPTASEKREVKEDEDEEEGVVSFDTFQDYAAIADKSSSGKAPLIRKYDVTEQQEEGLPFGEYADDTSKPSASEESENVKNYDEHDAENKKHGTFFKEEGARQKEELKNYDEGDSVNKQYGTFFKADDGAASKENEEVQENEESNEEKDGEGLFVEEVNDYERDKQYVPDATYSKSIVLKVPKTVIPSYENENVQLKGYTEEEFAPSTKVAKTLYDEVFREPKNRAKRQVVHDEDDEKIYLDDSPEEVRDFEETSNYVPERYSTKFTYTVPEPSIPEVKVVLTPYSDELSPNARITNRVSGRKKALVTVTRPVVVIT